MGKYYGGGRKKIYFTDEERKAGRRALRKNRKETDKLRNWEFLVCKIIVSYVEGETIKNIAEDLCESELKLLGEIEPDRDIIMLVPQDIVLKPTKENCYDYEEMPEDNDPLIVRISKWFEVQGLDSFVKLDIKGSKTVRQAVKAVAMGIRNYQDPFEVSGFNDILTNLKLSESQAKQVKKILVEKGFLINV